MLGSQDCIPLLCCPLISENSWAYLSWCFWGEAPALDMQEVRAIFDSFPGGWISIDCGGFLLLIVKEDR